MKTDLLFSLTLLSASSLAAQAEWQTLAAAPPERQSTPMCFDSVRGRTIICCGVVWSLRYTDTWAYQNGSWSNLEAPTGPVLFSPDCAYDSIRDRVVLFGYTTVAGNREAKTFEFDGTQWIDRNPLTAPGSDQHVTSSQTLAFDPTRGVTVMVFEDETWEWDGIDWTQKLPTSQPLHYYGQRLVYHGGRGTVLYLEQAYNPHRNVLWEWDGSNWTVIDNDGPSRNGVGLAYDELRDRLVLFGGYESGDNFDETWEWDGTAWTQATPATVPDARSGCSLAYDETTGRVVMFGGDTVESGSDRSTRRETWEWDGVDWVETTAPAPKPRQGAAIVYESHANRWLQFGGRISEGFPQVLTNQMWAFDDATGWTELQPTTRPSPARNHSMVYDEDRHVTVLYSADGLWEFTGGNWGLRFSLVDGTHGGMVYDSHRDRCVLMQRSTTTSPMRMFSWKDFQMVELFPPTMPSDREDFAMAYDRVRDEIVLFGGNTWGTGPLFGDTWIYDGVDWQQVATTGPEARDKAAMVYDAARDRTVLHGGRYSGPSQSGRTWEWDGTSWSQPAIGYRRAYDTALAYDPIHGRVAGVETDLTQLWIYSPPDPALVVPYGLGCDSSSGALDLMAAPGGLPWIGDTMRLVVRPTPGTSATPPFFLLGSTPLGLDVTGIGAPNCSLLVDPFITVPMSMAGSDATLDVSLATSASLVGTSFFGQAIVPDPPANSLGLAFTHGVQITPGIR